MNIFNAPLLSISGSFKFIKTVAQLFLKKLVGNYFVIKTVVFNFRYLENEIPANGIKCACKYQS